MSSTEIVSVTVDGLPVPCGGEFGGPHWSITAGVTAPEIVWKLDPAAADQVLSKTEVRIVFNYQGKAPLVIARAVVIKEVPTGSPYSRGVMFSDPRWYWQRTWIKRSFNLRMKAGTGRLVGGPDGIPAQALNLVDDLAYAKFSLKGEAAPYNADDMVQEIVQRLTSVAKQSFSISARSRPAITPPDIEVDDRGDHALARILGVIGGGVDVRPAPDGSVTLYDRVLGSEKTMIEGAFGAPLLGLGMLRWIDMANVLPPYITWLFTRDMELRLDYVEEPDGTGSVLDDWPSLDAVAKTTDKVMEVAGNTEVAGTWVKLLDLITAVNARVTFPAAKPGFAPPQQLSLDVLQKRYLGPAMYLQFVTQFGALPSRQWAGIIGSIMGSYRTDFRINRRFLGRIIPGTIRAVRVGVADAVTGMRHQSPVFMDYCEKPTLRQLAFNLDATHGWNNHMLPPLTTPQNLGASNRKAYPAMILLQDCTPAPAELSVTDAQTGVLSVDLRADSWDQAEELVPGLVANLPVVNPFLVATASALATWEQCRLAANHRMITIVSVIPAGPNNEQQLHEYPVTLGDALKRLGVQASAAGAPRGTPIAQRVYPGLERARFAWSDDQQGVIVGVFKNQGQAFPKSLVPVNDEVCKEIALTYTASFVSTLLSHYEGSMSKEFDPSLAPVGSVHTVTHGVDATGRALTTVNCEPRGTVVRPEALMTAATRRVLFGEGISR